jgi:hypothetical protein
MIFFKSILYEFSLGVSYLFPYLNVGNMKSVIIDVEIY